MKNLSLFQTILIGVFGFAALVGLFVFATYTGQSGSNSIGTVVIWGVLPDEDMEALISTIAGSEQSFKSVSYVQKDPATLPSDLAVAIATGASPDLILASQEQLLPIAKFIAPIPADTLPVSTFVNTFLSEGRLFMLPGGAGYYGLPFLVDPLVLYSNRSILASSGIARPPATWEGVIGLVPNIAMLTPSRQITRGLIGLGTYDNVRNARGILSTLFLQQGLPVSSYTQTGSLAANFGENSSSGNSAGASVVNFYTQFADPAKVSYTWNVSLPESRQMFTSGDLALYFGYASEARFLAAANPNLTIDVTPVPQSATASTKSVYGLVYAFMIPRGAQNAAGAYQAAALFASSAAQSAAAQVTGMAPVTLNQLVKAPASDPVAAVSYAEALYSNGWLSPSPADTDRVFSSMIGSVVSGRSEPGTALNDAASALNSFLQQ